MLFLLLSMLPWYLFFLTAFIPLFLAFQTAEVVELLQKPPAGEEAFLFDLLSQRVPAGVDEAAKVKAAFLAGIVKGKNKSPLISPEKAIELLGTMQGGYNVNPLVEALEDPKLGALAAKQLSKILLIFDSFNDVTALANKGNANAKAVIQSWANADWFLERKAVPEKITVTVFKV